MPQAGSQPDRAVNVPPVPTSLERAAGWSWRVLVCAAALVAVLALLWYVRVIVLPVMLALTIAPALSPVARSLRRRLGRPAAALALLVGLAVVAGLIALVTSLGRRAVRRAGRLGLARGRRHHGAPRRRTFQPLPEGGEDLQSSLADSWREAVRLRGRGRPDGRRHSSPAWCWPSPFLYFVLRDGAAFWDWLLQRFTPETRPVIDRAGRRAWAVLGGFVRGTALIATIDAVLIGIGLWLLGVPLAFALAVLVFLGAFVPFVGAFVSGLVAVLVAFADGGWEIGLAALAIVLAVQFVEGNFLQPIIQSRTVDLHPAVILLAVAAGASLFGILGAYLAVPVTAVVFAVVASLGSDSTAPGAVSDDAGSRA